VLKMGAAAETIQVFVEVDARRNLLRATAEGATEIKEQALRPEGLSADERRALVSASLGDGAGPPRPAVEAAGFEVWSASRTVHRLWRFFPERRVAVRVLDRTGAIRWASNHADVRESDAETAERDLETFAETYTRYSDAGTTIPRCYVLLADRIIDLSGLVDMGQVLEVLRLELARHSRHQACVLLVDLGG
jgi:hypothetical protein